MRRFQRAIALAAIAALVVAAPAGAASRASRATSDTIQARPTVDKAYALVQLNGAPLSTYVKTKPAKGKKIDFSSATVKSYRALLSATRNDFKKWLQVNAPRARVTGQWDISLNAVSVKLNGTSLATLRTSPLVKRAEFSGLYYPTAVDPDLALINAVEAWGAGGAAGAGAGVKVAIIDSGIDQTHPCFDDTGYDENNNPGPHEPFTNDKVLVAKVFNNKAKLLGVDAEAIDSHGSHVAGTVACNFETPANVNGVDIPYAPSGVAPAALLGNYNVFPGTVENARSEDILNALDAAYADGFDVANMSLGGGAKGIQDLLTMAVDNLDVANMVVAVAAGNSGPGHFTVESPGSAARALTAGASSVGHFVAAPVSVGGGTFAAVSGDFPVVEDDLTAPLAVLTAAPVHPANGLSEACSALPSGSLTGKIALLSRGTCDFSTKIRFAELAGAVAVLVANRLPGDPTAMGEGASPDGVQPTIPAYMVSLADSLVLKTKNGLNTTIAVDLAYFVTGNDMIQADFSGQGPTDVDFRVKPDVMAPGVNVLSSVPGDDCGDTGCWAFNQGTSMASPHLAGSAAVVKSQHPDWSAEQIRSAIVNTATRGVITKTDFSGLVTDVLIQGTGQEDLAAAVDAAVALGPVSVSFGAIPAGAGQAKTVPVSLTNLSGSGATFSLTIADTTGTGVSFTVGSSSVTLAAGQTATVNVSMAATKGAGRGDHQAWLTVSSGGEQVAHAAVYALVK